MKYTVIFVLLLLLESAEFKGGRGGGGGFKLLSFKKAPGRTAKTRQQKSSPRAAARPAESDANSKYFNRDVPLSQRDYGTIFAKGLSKNSYIYNNYYRTHSRTAGIAQFITNALFFRAGMRLGREINSQYDEWNEEDDKRWRMTTKAPYFENKIPGTRKILPASAIDGAAAAFGLESLLPLNIPPKSPLMYCKNSHELRQNRIKLNGTIYSCANGKISIDCASEECTTSTSSSNGTNNDVECNFNNKIFCINGTLYATIDIFCNNSKMDVLECYFGHLPSDMASFIPTTMPIVQSKGQTSLQRMYNYFMDLFGLSDDESAVPATAALKDTRKLSNWIPQALEIPPEPTTTPEPHIFLVKSDDYSNNKAMWQYLRSLSDIYLRLEKLNVPMGSFERNNVRSFTITEYNNMKANGEVVDS